MNTGRENEKRHRYSAKNTVVQVNFMCEAPKAKAVSVVGDFNDWNPEANQMKRHLDGYWKSSIQITTGHHCYQFLVDGERQLDPRANGVVKLNGDSRASLLSVS